MLELDCGAVFSLTPGAATLFQRGNILCKKSPPVMCRAHSCWNLLCVCFVTWFLFNKTQQSGCWIPAASLIWKGMPQLQHSDTAVGSWLNQLQKDHLGNWSTFIPPGLKANRCVLAVQNSSPHGARTICYFRTDLRQSEASPLRGSHVKSKATHLQHGEVRGKKPTHVKGTQKEWSLTVPLTDAEQLLSAQGSSTRMAKIRNPFKDGKQMEMHFDFWLISATPHYLRIKLL